MEHVDKFQQLYTFHNREMEGAMLILLVSWIVASTAGAILRRVWDKNLAKPYFTHKNHVTIHRMRGAATVGIYCLTLLIVVPFSMIFLSSYDWLGSVQSILSQGLTVLPTFIPAAIVGLIGYCVAKVVRIILARSLPSRHLAGRNPTNTSYQRTQN